MQPAAMLAQLVADGHALRAAATNLDARVPPCSGWTVRDAVEHTAMVYAHKSTVLETGALEEGEWPPPGLTYTDVLEFFDEQLHRLVENLRTRDPAAHAATWYEPDQTVGFWVRRMMQETVIYRADVESAFGPPSRVADDADAAISGEPSDVLLALWNRLPYDAVRTDGDPAALAALRTALVANTQ